MRLPGWLVFILFVPLQIWLFVKMKQDVGWLWTILAFLVLGILGARAARAPVVRAWLFPHWGLKWERRRPIYQGILLLAAGVTLVLGIGSQPWLPAAAATALVKSAVR